MNSNDFEYLLSYSQPQPAVISGDIAVCFDADKGYEQTIAKLIKKNNLENISMEQFVDLVQKYKPIIQAKDKLREKKISDFTNMTTESIGKLPLEKKVDYMEAIFHKKQTEKLIDICTNNKDKIKALLFNIQFPKDFWRKEEKLADRFVSLVANNQQITASMKNWQNLSPDDKKETILTTAKIIEYAYSSPVEIGFYTSEEYRKQNNLDEKTPVIGAYQENGKIFFNSDRLENSDNYMGVSVVFHEFTHKRQREVDFDNPIINKLFAGEHHKVFNFENLYTNSASPEYGDLYSLIPAEVHAYAMQKYVEDKIADKTGLEKTQAKVSETTQKVHDKSFAMALTSKYRSI